MKKQLYTLIILFFTFQATTQSFYKQCEYNDEDTKDYVLKIGLRNDTTILLNVLRGESTVLYNYYLDDFGNTLGIFSRDTLNIESPIVVQSTETQATLIPRLSIGNILVINKVSIDGVIIEEKAIDIFDNEIVFFQVRSSTISNGNIVLSGALDDNEGRKGFMIWLDSDLNLEKVHLTDTSFAAIGGIAANENGEVYGISAFVDYEMTNCGSCLVEARYYFSRFEKSSFMDTLDLILDGSSSTTEKTLSFTFLEDQDFLIGFTTNFEKTMNLLRYNVNSGVIWNLDSLDIIHGKINGDDHYIMNDGSIVHILGTLITDDIGPKQTGVIISTILPDGEIRWSKKFFRYYESGLNKLEVFNGKIKEDEEYLLIPGRYVKSTSHQKPLLLKIDKNGCLTEKCHIVQVEGHYPKPTHAVSHRNVWHMYNKELEESYRYTFVDVRIPQIGGTLIKSDEMSGDNWYSTGRKFTSGISTFHEINFPDIPGSSPILTFDYNYEFEVGDELTLWTTGTSEYTHHILKVIEKETIDFLDGRIQNKLTLECYNPDVEIEPRQVTWIDYIGDADDLFNTINACSEPGDEQVTCFYSSGELMWSNPNFGECNLTGTQESSNENIYYSIFPNPTNSNITIPKEFGPYFIVSMAGQEVYRSNQEVSERKLDVSFLESGYYYVIEQEFVKRSRITKFLKL